MAGPGIRTQDLYDESLAPYRSELSRQPIGTMIEARNRLADFINLHVPLQSALSTLRQVEIGFLFCFDLFLYIEILALLYNTRKKSIHLLYF